MSDSPEFRNDPSDDIEEALPKPVVCLLYTSDAADE